MVDSVPSWFWAVATAITGALMWAFGPRGKSPDHTIRSDLQTVVEASNRALSVRIDQMVESNRGLLLDTEHRLSERLSRIEELAFRLDERVKAIK